MIVPRSKLRNQMFLRFWKQCNIYRQKLQKIRMQNNLHIILQKTKQLKSYFNIFTKQFQNQLSFILKMIQQDAQQLNRNRCCLWLMKKIACFQKKQYQEIQIYNSQFFKVFKTMTVIQRQQYYLQLLNFIQILGKSYQNYMEKNKQSCKYHQFKNQILKNLVNKFINRKVISILEEKQENQQIFYLNVYLDGQKRFKVGRLQHWKLKLIEKTQIFQQETVVFIDLRNYVLLRADFDKSMKLMSLYDTIEPSEIVLEFIDAHQSTAQFKKYNELFKEIIKIGNIQKLVLSIDNLQIFEKQDEKQQKLKKNILLRTLINGKQDDSEAQQYQKDHFYSTQIIKLVSTNYTSKLKKLQSLKQQHSIQIKKKLIQTLNHLAKIKFQQRAKRQAFINKQSISVKKNMSSAVINAINSTEAFIKPKGISYFHQKQVERVLPFSDFLRDGVVQRLLEIKPQSQQHLSIINHNRWAKKVQSVRKSLQIISSQYESFSSEEEKGRKNHGKRKTIIFHQNIYSNFYKNDGYSFTRMDSVLNMPTLSTQQYYILPQERMNLEAGLLKGEKRAKFMTNWLHRFSRVRGYFSKQTPTLIKLFLPMEIQLKSLLEAVANIEAYPKWHPDVKGVQIIETISSQNSVLTKLSILSPQTKKQFSLFFLVHLFKLKNHSYFLFKLQPNQQKEGKATIFEYFRKKPAQCLSQVTFLMIKLSNILGKDRCEICITFDYRPLKATEDESAKKELITFFLNFAFIKDYWKLGREQRVLTQGLFSFERNIHKNSFKMGGNRFSSPLKQDATVLQAIEFNKKITEMEKQPSQGIESSSQFIKQSDLS